MNHTQQIWYQELPWIGPTQLLGSLSLTVWLKQSQWRESPTGTQTRICGGNGSQGSDQMEKISFKVHIHSQGKSLYSISKETQEKQFRSLLEGDPEPINRQKAERSETKNIRNRSGTKVHDGLKQAAQPKEYEMPSPWGHRFCFFCSLKEPCTWRVLQYSLSD